MISCGLVYILTCWRVGLLIAYYDGRRKLGRLHKTHHSQCVLIFAYTKLLESTNISFTCRWRTTVILSQSMNSSCSPKLPLQLPTNSQATNIPAVYRMDGKHPAEINIPVLITLLLAPIVASTGEKRFVNSELEHLFRAFKFPCNPQFRAYSET